MAVLNKEQVCWVGNWKLIMWLFRKDILLTGFQTKLSIIDCFPEKFSI